MNKKRKNISYILFWIKSSRGTNEKAIFEIPNNWTKENIKSALEKWCSNFGAWTHGDNTVHYGCRLINIPNKKELKKKYDIVCKNRAKIIEKWKILTAMFNIKKLN